MTSRFACLGIVLAVAMGAMPGTARANLLVCQITGINTDAMPPGVDFYCQERITCSDPTECTSDDEPLFDNQVCDSALGSGESICRPRCGTFLMCDEASDCPIVGASMAHPPCVHGILDVPEGSPTGVCLFSASAGDRGITYCGDGTGITRLGFARCHLRPDRTITSSWLEGDCDGDSCPNGRDPMPCTPTRDCGAVGLEELFCGGTPSPRDASVPDEDAGAVDEDAGAAGEDAGAMGEDAGSGFDAGSTSTPPGTSFGGGGGCRCGVVDGGASGARALWSVLALGLVLALRRRR